MRVKKRRRITVYTQLLSYCENSYMFRLYICTHHEAGYRTLNKKTTIIQYGFYYAFNNSYTFRLYICTHREAGYRTLNKKTTKIFLFKVLYPASRWEHMYSRNM